MSSLIYVGEVENYCGTGEVRITDTSPDVDTPSSTHREDPAEGIRLDQGDIALADDNLPTSIGSFFELTFPDTAAYEFQALFDGISDETRFEVELEIPTLGTWEGFVKSTLQQRNLSRELEQSTVSVVCYDRLAFLQEADPVSVPFTKDIRSLLVDIFAKANSSLDIVLYMDANAVNLNQTAVGTDEMVAIPGPSLYHRPKTQTPQGLQGNSARDQLDRLCQSFLTSAYQDINLNAWAVMDIASVGASVSAVRYDGSSWSSYTVPEHTVDVPSSDLLYTSDGEREDVLESLPSTKRVCATNFGSLMRDSYHEQYSSLGSASLFHWTTTSDVVEIGIFEDAGNTAIDHNADGDDHEQEITHDILTDGIDEIEVVFESEGDNNHNVEVEIEYPNQTDSLSDTSPKTGNKGPEGAALYRSTFSVNQNKERIIRILVRIIHKSSNAGGNVIYTNVNPVVKRDVTGPDGNAVTRREAVQQICFEEASANGERVVSDDRGSALLIKNGGRISPAEFDSDRLSTYETMWQLRADLLTNLQQLGTEKLRGRALQQFAPLGSRVKWRKPGDTSESYFVPLKGRAIELGTERGTLTKMKDMQVPNEVINRI